MIRRVSYVDDGFGQPGSDANPAWSPDGSKIAFSSNRDGNFEIYVMGADGTGVTRLTNRAATDILPAWSPDGSVLPVALEAIQSITDDRDLGERSAIALAESLRADLLLIDEASGHAEARRRNLRVTGTRGVPRAGAEQGFVNVPELFGLLVEPRTKESSSLRDTSAGNVWASFPGASTRWP